MALGDIKLKRRFWVIIAVMAYAVSGPGARVFAASTAQPPWSVMRPDGSPIVWYLDRQTHPGRQGVLLLAQGSGCGSVSNNENIKRAKGLLPDFAVLTVEDYGVAAGDPEKFGTETCPAAFYRHHTISQRVDDAQRLIGEMEKQPWWNGQLVLFGGSEGGAVVQILAPKVDADAVVVFSSATGLPFKDAVLQVLPPPVAEQSRRDFDKVKADPNASTLLLSNSYLWWSDIMDRRLSDDLLKAPEQILLVQGARDVSNPVASARAVRDAFKAAGKCNLTYWEYPDLGHQMQDPSGHSHLGGVLARISAWLQQQLEKSSREACGGS